MQHEVVLTIGKHIFLSLRTYGEEEAHRVAIAIGTRLPNMEVNVISVKEGDMRFRGSERKVKSKTDGVKRRLKEWQPHSSVFITQRKQIADLEDRLKDADYLISELNEVITEYCD